MTTFINYAYTLVERVIEIFDVAVVVSEEGVEASTGRPVVPRVVPHVPLSHEMSGVAQSLQVLRQEGVVQWYTARLGPPQGVALHTCSHCR